MFAVQPPEKPKAPARIEAIIADAVYYLRERTFPQLGWPRTPDSLCPGCVREARTAGLDDESIESLLRVTLRAAAEEEIA